MEWHHISRSEVLQKVGSRKEGLRPGEASRRLTQYGKNLLVGKKKRGLLRVFIEQFADLPVLILLAAAAVSFAASLWSGSGDWIDPVMILLIVLLNSVMGTVQERKAERAIEALKEMSAPKARVLRGGEEREIPAEELVPGDILLLDTGDRIGADARLLQSVALRVEESSLTGESVPAAKSAEASLPKDCPLGDRTNMVFSSTYVTAGHAQAVVTATGMNTAVGQIASLLDENESPDTPLKKQLARTGRWLGIGAVAICGIIFALGMLQQVPPTEMFLISISLAVAAIPEGLPAIVTIVLALGVRKLAANRAIVRRLPAVEALGSADVICSDKTGTLTQNRMTVQKLYGCSGSLEVHSSQGKQILSLGALCSNAVLKGKGTEAVGDPTETAIVSAAAKAGCRKEQLEALYERIEEAPFDSVSKRMTTIHQMNSGGYRIIVKGAPEVVLKACTQGAGAGGITSMTEYLRQELLRKNQSMAEEAMRVIAVAYRDLNYRPSLKEGEGGLTFGGLIGMTDPPRVQAFGAVETCRRAGIGTVMITGDHPATARATAKALGILTEDKKSATGAELDRMSQEALEKHIEEYSVFARVSPAHKVRIVKAYQARGKIVAMTGDGVNDAPALQCADIGCAMGIGGTDVAKSAADMVLTDDNFATIVAAVEQGRGIFENIRKAVHFLLSSNIGEILLVLCAFLLKLPSPLLAIQLLWVNLVTDSLPALALGCEAPREDVMEISPEEARKGIFTPASVWSIAVEGCMIGALAFLAFTIGRLFFDTGAEPLIGRTMAFGVLSMSQLVHALNIKSEHSLFAKGLRRNPRLAGALAVGVFMQIIVISVPMVAQVFRAVPLPPGAWLAVAGLSLMPLPVVELEKALGAGLSRRHQGVTKR